MLIFQQDYKLKHTLTKFIFSDSPSQFLIGDLVKNCSDAVLVSSHSQKIHRFLATIGVNLSVNGCALLCYSCAKLVPYSGFTLTHKLNQLGLAPAPPWTFQISGIDDGGWMDGRKSHKEQKIKFNNLTSKLTTSAKYLKNIYLYGDKIEMCLRFFKYSKEV